MAEDEMQDIEAEPVFRAFKRRKIAPTRPRRTINDAEDETSDNAPIRSPTSPKKANKSGTQQSDESDNGIYNTLSAALRARSKAKQRRGGIEVSTPTAAPSNNPTTTQSEDTEMIPSTRDTFSTRFTQQTGIIKDNMDAAMTSYIDSRLSSAHSHHPESPTLPSTNDTIVNRTRPTARDYINAAVSAGRIAQIPIDPTPPQPAKPPPQPAPARKPRLGPDGKPWRSRKHAVKSEDAIAREAAVEAVMAEAKLDVYEAPDKTIKDADSVIARIQEEYLDAQAARQAAAAARKKTADPAAKGPKLGGGRSARAAALKAEEAAAKGRKK
ncbi:hypothetical protein BT63DRAFT_477726 [Microthyrium microscopicum]|uniref:Uncharacterized protein n=1 Tax=Microthyrium microscopicum TaxID=703497 RepID=A0A6A6UHB8_9PEZI|nr:hypothetical protein BT63DRAFT_477726 [Microthyrium microscopicum]